jgi:hypothetical protein
MDKSELLELIEKLKGKSKRDARRISTRLEQGKIDADEWKAQVMALLVSAHIIAASVGRGGVNAMSVNDWRRIQAKITLQDGYLEKLKRSITAGAVVMAAGAIASRVGKYFVAPSISFEAADRERMLDLNGDQIMARLITNSKEGCEECAADEAEGWMPVEDLDEIGTRECGDWCLCTVEYSGV